MPTPAQTLAESLVRWRDCTLIVAGVELHRFDEATATAIRESLETALQAFGGDCHRLGMQRAAELARDHAIECGEASAQTFGPLRHISCSLPYGKACGARDVEGLIRKELAL